ncbi:hypothetical protein L2E82_12340 [Cichorium intybus]|uniref:Uncharacterized protein n=1 Tax=Cichorium intybus TaxID=13427 RepID=A0ACB9GH09_CICIN|nr:hypothetical protein L2E82_12340 [Cichorium intybus]
MVGQEMEVDDVEPEPINADEEEGGNGDGGTRRRRNPETEEARGGMRNPFGMPVDFVDRLLTDFDRHFRLDRV